MSCICVNYKAIPQISLDIRIDRTFFERRVLRDCQPRNLAWLHYSPFYTVSDLRRESVLGERGERLRGAWRTRTSLWSMHNGIGLLHTWITQPDIEIKNSSSSCGLCTEYGFLYEMVDPRIVKNYNPRRLESSSKRTWRWPKRKHLTCFTDSLLIRWECYSNDLNNLQIITHDLNLLCASIETTHPRY